MNLTYIHRDNNPRLLLIFAGWGMDERPFAYIQRNGYDIALVWDYSDLILPDINNFKQYSEIVVMAWSMGVWAASVTIPQLHLSNLTLTIAINGTTTPIDEKFGISPAIYTATLDNLSDNSLKKFNRRMCGSSDSYANFCQQQPNRSLDSLKNELKNIGCMAKTHEVGQMNWHIAIIGSNDRIFTPEAQKASWEQKSAKIIEIECAHLPNWQEIINRHVIDKTLVRRRFCDSTNSYEPEATPQAYIAKKLWMMWKNQPEALRGDRLIEIGSGTGLLTRQYAPVVRFRNIELWDFVDLPTLRKNMTMICDDAESRLCHLPEKSVNVIASASTIQWFNSIPAFFANAARVLTRNGVLIVSTFGDRTFRELAEAGGEHLPYPSFDQIQRMIPDSFTIAKLAEEDITLNFSSPIAVLHHIKATGVNARKNDTTVAESRLLLRNYPKNISTGTFQLTYHPIYIILKRK